MERSELELIEQLSTRHDELRHLWSRHQDYEKSLIRLQDVRFPSEADRREMGRLKRMKLRGKERIHAILGQHRDV